MVFKHLVILKSGTEFEIETDEDLVKQHAIWKTGVDFDAPPATPSDSLSSQPSRDQPFCMRGVCFVGGFFSLDLTDVAFIRIISETDEEA